MGPGDVTPQLDDAQRAVLERPPGPCVVLGGPGTGKSTVLVEWLARRLEAGVGAVALVPSRRGADRLRDAVAARADATSREPVARTPQSLAWSVLREHAVRSGSPPPRLVTGSELDDTIADVLAGHGEPGVPAPRWPAHLDAGLRGTRVFRDELRELAARLVEHGADATDLVELAERCSRPEWAAVAHVVAELDDVSGLRGDNAHDPAGIVAVAAGLLAADGTGLGPWLARSLGALAVDDAQDLTPAAWELVSALARFVPDVLVLGDLDSATQTFRGARPGLLAEAADRLRVAGGSPAPVLRLTAGYRQPPVLAGVTERVRRRLVEPGRAGGAVPVQPRSAHVEPGAVEEGAVRVVTCHDAADEAAFVAGVLRARRHRDGAQLRWRDMAVVVRSVRHADELLRVLAQASVPVQVPGVTAPLREEPVVSVLLAALDVVADPDRLGPVTLERLLTGPLVGADPLRFRRLRLAARRSAAERAGSAVSGSDALAELCRGVRAAMSGASPLPVEGRPLAGLPASVAGPLARLTRVLAAGARAAADAGPGAVVESVLWEVWAATGLAHGWRGTALGAGVDAARAGSDLDAVMAVFSAAAGWVDAHPTGGVLEFTAHLRSRALGDDRLGADGPTDAVTVTTPVGAVGREWGLVVVAGVQDGTWPDPRLRGSLLGVTDLVDVLRGDDVPGAGRMLEHPETRRAARAAVVRDEVRLFHVAVSRARSELLVTAVEDGTTVPSELCRLVGEPEPLSAAREAVGAATHGHTLPGVVAMLRRALHEHDPASAEHRGAVRLLGRLAAEGVRGAAPEEWSWLPGPSTDLARTVDRLTVSPSAVEGYLACPLQWYLSSVGGRSGSGTAQLLGTVVHRALEEVPDGDPERLRQVLDGSWAELELGTGWVSAHHRSRAEQMLTKLTEWIRVQEARGNQPVAAEVGFRFTVGDVTVRGTVDRVERTASGELRLVDLKTSRSAVSAAVAGEHPQLMLYQLAVAHGALEDAVVGTADADPAGAVLLYVGSDTVKASVRDQPAMDPAMQEAAEEMVRDVGRGMSGGHFPARPGTACRFCAVRSSCPSPEVPEGRRLQLSLPAPGARS